MNDQFVEHHRQPRIAPRHAVERLQPGTHVFQGCDNVRTLFPLEIPPDDLNRFLEAQALQDLNVEEVVEGLPDVGDAVKVKRRGRQQQATVVRHEKLAQGSDVILVADLPGQDLAQVLEHDEQGSAVPAILFSNCGHQRVGDLRVVFFGLHRCEQLRPPPLVLEEFLEYSAHADQEVGEGERPVRFFREANDHDVLAQRFVRLNGVFNAREQVGLADPARTDEQQVVLRFPAHRTTHGFDGVVEQVFTRDARVSQALRARHAGAIQADIRMEGRFRHGVSSTTISALRWRNRRAPPRPRRCRSRFPGRAAAH